MASPKMLAGVEESRDTSGFLEAAKNGDLKEVIGYLEGVGVPVDTCVSQYRRTALHWACEGGHYEICKTLVEHAADVNFRDKNGATPLHWASWNGHSEVVKLLLASGADKRIEDVDRETALAGASDADTQALLYSPRNSRSNSRVEENSDWNGTRGRIQKTVKTLVDETVRLHGMVEKLVAQNGRLLGNQKELVAEVMRLKGLVNEPDQPDVLKRLGVSVPER
eukprot:TRINITY_DN3620_c0_g1_i1.p1 TRINITY_DN3620_c0_g1~~TRINITY_DN3620_c0_g1_i1.p1  ORF type:complete len:223 (+),score=44.70 TRINITY_DN3620_c0_g1_i1:195-863(+)